MLGVLRRKLKRIARYPWAIEGSGASFCIFDELFQIERLRRITIGGIQLLVRTNTPDVEVAIRSLYQQEYANIRTTNPKVIIDAGANIGTSSIFFARRYPEAHVIAIEPESKNFALLCENTKACSNISRVQAALWGSVGRRALKDRSTGHWGYTVSTPTSGALSIGQDVDCLTISSLMARFGIEKIDILKMDIEGGEKDVLENAMDWIDSVDTLVVELHDRICMGCDRAFYLSTRDFKFFEKHGEKVVAYRD